MGTSMDTIDIKFQNVVWDLNTLHDTWRITIGNFCDRAFGDDQLIANFEQGFSIRVVPFWSLYRPMSFKFGGGPNLGPKLTKDIQGSRLYGKVP